MNNDNETKQKLLMRAKTEFMEHGYTQASLRNICNKAGVTTGALYFFFQDKEDLFASLVEEPLNTLFDTMNAHYREELKCDYGPDLFSYDSTSDLEAAKQIIRYMYQYYDEFLLVLQKSQGSRFEKSIDDFIAISESHNRLLADRFSRLTQTPRVEDYMIHWISHMQIDSFVYMLTHETLLDSALQNLESILRFLTTGWAAMFWNDKK